MVGDQRAAEAALDARATPPPGDSSTSQPDQPAPEPEQFIPSQSPGSSAAYAELVDRLVDVVPPELRDAVPWPDLRNPDPVVAQVEIFDLWIWMEANLPEATLVELMAAPGSPSRQRIAPIFAELARRKQFNVRAGAPYRAYDHVVVTFESAGLPLWLSRDVPDNAVVVYYTDQSGPVEVVDQASGIVLSEEPEVPPRAWLSIMVPTEVGWQLWRDQLLDPSETSLRPPEFTQPSAGERDRDPQL